MKLHRILAFTFLAAFSNAASPAARHRTSTTEDSAALEPLQPAGSGFTDTLPAQSLTTYQFTIR